VADDVLLVPVGHDLGVRYPVAGSAEHHQQVRAGTELAELDDLEFTVWLLCHGVSAEERPNRTTVPAAAAELGLPAHQVEQALKRLVADGLAVELDPQAGSAVAFAQGHQLVPLMLGVDQDGLRAIGLLQKPLIHVSSALYDLWAWAHLAPQLWAACQDAAEVTQLAGLVDPDEIDPRRILAGLLTAVHPLLGVRAAYFDRRPAQGDSA